MGLIDGMIVGGYRVWKEHKQRKRWFQTVMSIVWTGIISFLGTFGSVGGGMLADGSDPILAAATGTFAGALSAAAMMTFLWKKSPMTKDIPLAVPMPVEEKVLEGGQVYTESAKGEKR